MREGTYTLADGLGVRWTESGDRAGGVEVLQVAPALADRPGFEEALRARAARLVEAGEAVGLVRRIERDASGLRVVAAAVPGVRLCDLLADVEGGSEALSAAGMLELAGRVAGAVARLHRAPAGLAHGGIMPAHIVIMPDGAAALTDGIFGGALETLQRNREEYWRQFGVALPHAASLPRFDRRADVTQLGAVVLALALGRPLRADEYPQNVAALVAAAGAHEAPRHVPTVRPWLEQALQLHARTLFASAVDAHAILAQIATASGLRRAGVQAVQALIGRRCGAAAGSWPPSPAMPPGQTGISQRGGARQDCETRSRHQAARR